MDKSIHMQNKLSYNMSRTATHRDACMLRTIYLPFPSGLQANAETTVPSDGGDRVQTFCHCDNRCSTTYICKKHHTNT